MFCFACDCRWRHLKACGGQDPFSPVKVSSERCRIGRSHDDMALKTGFTDDANNLCKNANVRHKLLDM